MAEFPECSFSILALDCYDIFNQNKALPGVYDLGSLGKVKCLENGWTVIQHRGQFGNSQTYFDKNWIDYVQGFGSPGKQRINC